MGVREEKEKAVMGGVSRIKATAALTKAALCNSAATKAIVLGGPMPRHKQLHAAPLQRERVPHTRGIVHVFLPPDEGAPDRRPLFQP